MKDTTIPRYGTEYIGYLRFESKAISLGKHDWRSTAKAGLACLA